MNGVNNPDRFVPKCCVCGTRRASIHRLFCDKCWTDVKRMTDVMPPDLRTVHPSAGISVVLEDGDDYGSPNTHLAAVDKLED